MPAVLRRAGRFLSTRLAEKGQARAWAVSGRNREQEESPGDRKPLPAAPRTHHGPDRPCRDRRRRAAGRQEQPGRAAGRAGSAQPQWAARITGDGDAAQARDQDLRHGAAVVSRSKLVVSCAAPATPLMQSTTLSGLTGRPRVSADSRTCAATRASRGLVRIGVVEELSRPVCPSHPDRVPRLQPIGPVARSVAVDQGLHAVTCGRPQEVSIVASTNLTRGSPERFSRRTTVRLVLMIFQWNGVTRQV